MSGSSSTTRSITGWRNAVLIAFALGGITLATWGPRLPSMRSDLGLDDAGLGLILAGVTVGSVGGLITSSPLLAMLGARRGIGGMLFLIAVGIALIGVSGGMLSNVPLVAFGFVVLGLGVGALDVMINVEGAAVERAAGKTLMPLMHAAWSAGAIIGSGTGAICAALGIDYAWQFLGEAVAITLISLVAVRYLPTLAPQTDEPSPPIRQRVRSWLRGWADLRLLMIGLVMLGVELGENTANNWLTLGARDGHGRPEAIAALFFTVFAIGETVARVVGGPLADRVGRVAAVRFTTALGVVGVLIFVLAEPSWLLLTGTVLWAVGVSMGFPLGMSAAAES